MLILKALLILAWRDDVGAYVLHSHPEDAKDDVDGQDLMNLYNAHRFRSTEKNFQIMKRSGFNAASFYSGGYQSNYIGKPNFCVTLILRENENPNEYEKVLIKVTNLLLTQMDKDDFDYTLMDIFEKLKNKDFDSIKVRKAEFEFEEDSAPKKKLATTSSVSVSDEEKIFAELMESSELDTTDKDFDSKISDFSKSATSDPFAADPFAGGSAADPFGGASTAEKVSPAIDAFAENPFDAAQKPDLAKAFGLDEAIGKTMFKEVKTTATDIIQKLDKLDTLKPRRLESGATQEENFQYLKNLVDHLEEKVKILSSLITQLRENEKQQEEKDAVIGKLLLMFKGN